MSSKNISPAQWARLKRDPEIRADLALAERVARQVQRKGGHAYVVGGFVRDLLMGRISKDLDVEVHGLELSELQKLLKNPKSVGKSFGVFKMGKVDFALARKDSKTAWGQGRKPVVVHDKNLTLDQASRRRDITINALYLDPLTLEILDPQNGLKDLKNKILRHVDAERFGDDPLRVLRLMQFAGRFGFKIHPETVKICRRINLKRLSRERVGEEWNKLLLKSPRPSIGLRAAKELEILKQLHPELEHLRSQDFKGVLAAVDRIAKFKLQTSSIKIQSYASLCFWIKNQEKIKKFLEQVDYPKSARPIILELIASLRILSKHFRDYDLRKTAFDLKKYHLPLSEVASLAEALGKPGLSRKIKKRAGQLGVLNSAPELLVHGRDLINLGLKPGREFSKILDRIKNMQFLGEFDESSRAISRRRAMKYLRLIVDKK